MAKESIKETLVTTHKLAGEGTINLDDLTIEIQDMDKPVPIKQLLKKFDGKFISFNFTEKTEGDVELDLKPEEDEE